MGELATHIHIDPVPSLYARNMRCLHCASERRPDASKVAGVMWCTVGSSGQNKRQWHFCSALRHLCEKAELLAILLGEADEALLLLSVRANLLAKGCDHLQTATQRNEEERDGWSEAYHSTSMRVRASSHT